MSFIARLKTILGRKRRIGLVLGSGGARGFAHIGVFKVLEEAGIPIHCIAGSSAGALVGGLYATGMKAHTIEEELGDLSIHRLARLFLPTLGPGGIVDGRRVKKLLEPYTRGRSIEHLVIPFACVATDLSSGESVVFDRGDLLKSIRASISIPGLFTPVSIDGRVFVDGGVVNPLPIRLAFDMGADIAIVVKVQRRPSRKARRIANPANCDDDSISELDGSERNASDEAARSWFRNPLRWLAGERGGGEKRLTPPVLDVLLSILSIYDQQMSEMSLREAGEHLLVEPDLANVEILDFHKGHRAIAAGEDAMRVRLPELRAL